MSEISYTYVKIPALARKVYYGVIERRVLKRKFKRARDALNWAYMVDKRCQTIHVLSVVEE